MRRRRAVIALAPVLVALVLVLTACGGDDDEKVTTGPTPSRAPSEDAEPPSTGALPPGIGECLADRGFDIEPSELHSVPPQVLNECFSALHQGGGVP